MRRPLRPLQTLAALSVFAAASLTAAAQSQLPPDLREKIDKLAADALAKTGAPSASVAVVRDGRVVYLKAYGDARVAPKEGKGWLFAAAELAMTAEDLAKWDVSIIEQKLLKPSSYRDLETEVVLNNGLGTRYGLGVDVRSEAGHRSISHGGEVSGFTSQNVVFPDERAAVVALTNQDAAGAASEIARGVAPLLFEASDAVTLRKTEQARKIFEGLQRGAIDRSLFTDDANFYFSEQALKDFAGSLGPLGPPQEFTQVSQSLRGGMVGRSYRVTFKDRTLRAWTFETPDGKLEQYQVAPE